MGNEKGQTMNTKPTSEEFKSNKTYYETLQPMALAYALHSVAGLLPLNDAGKALIWEIGERLEKMQIKDMREKKGVK